MLVGCSGIKRWGLLRVSARGPIRSWSLHSDHVNNWNTSFWKNSLSYSAVHVLLWHLIIARMVYDFWPPAAKYFKGFTAIFTSQCGYLCMGLFLCTLSLDFSKEQRSIDVRIKALVPVSHLFFPRSKWFLYFISSFSSPSVLCARREKGAERISWLQKQRLTLLTA